jgi:hypothetical protein
LVEPDHREIRLREQEIRGVASPWRETTLTGLVVLDEHEAGSVIGYAAAPAAADVLLAERIDDSIAEGILADRAHQLDPAPEPSELNGDVGGGASEHGDEGHGLPRRHPTGRREEVDENLAEHDAPGAHPWRFAWTRVRNNAPWPESRVIGLQEGRIDLG